MTSPHEVVRLECEFSGGICAVGCETGQVMTHGISNLPDPDALVPSFVREWRAQLDSNQRPAA